MNGMYILLLVFAALIFLVMWVLNECSIDEKQYQARMSQWGMKDKDKRKKEKESRLEPKKWKKGGGSF